ncbi:MAG: hypothetical protein JXB62_10510 [Pirellulales bacterium]|nr:hypothetical protein [Pirellulales bacterium]
MAGSVRRIRKVQTAQVADFDDQLWPINCAILILAGFVAGIVIAVSDFQDPRLLYNGWARLVSVAAMVGLSFWGVMWLQGKMLRRLQLCVLVSLLFHLWLAMYLHEQYLALLAQRETESAQQLAEPFERITVPDYHWEQIEEPEEHQTFEEPIETEAPKPSESEAVKREANDPEMPTEVEPPKEPEIPQRQQPDPSVIRRAELSAPRRADAAAGGQISRQQWRHRPQPNEPIPEPEVQPSPAQAAAVPSADVAPRRRQSGPVQVDQRQLFEEFSSTRPEPVEVRLARRATGSQPIDDSPTTPTPSRQIRRPAEIARTEASVPEPVEVAQRSPAAGQSQSITRMTARREAEAPTLVSQTAEALPNPTAPGATAYVTLQRRAADQAPRPAQARRPLPAHRPADVPTPTTPSGPPLAALPAAAPDDGATSHLTDVAMSRRLSVATATSPTHVSQVAVDLNVQRAAGRAVGIAVSPVQTAMTELAPQPRADRSAPIARSRTAPQVAVSQIQPSAGPVGTAVSSQPSLPVARLAPSAVGTAADRSVALAQSQPAGRALPAMTRVAELPAAMAPRRTAASQQGPTGADAAPDRPMSLARSSQGVSLPSSAIALPSQPASTPAAAGGTPTSRIELGTNSALRREAAEPAPGENAAAAGTAEFAVGSSQVVARIGQPRASGIGQASVIANAATRRIARVGGPVAPSIAASGVPEAMAASPGAVASSDHGSSAPSFNLRASAAKRGGTVLPLAAQATIGSGPPDSSGAPGAVGVAMSSRVTRHESVAVGIAGGGTPRPGRTSGGAVSANATAEASSLATSAPSGGTANQTPPLPAPVSGPRRQVLGLPGSLETQPMAGALASLSSEGAPLPGAVARRGSGPRQSPGERQIGPAESVTLRRSATGTDLPAAAVAVEDVAETGAGGVALAQGGLPSSLRRGPSASVRHAAADVATGPSTAAAGTAETGVGSSRVVALAGLARATGDNLPSMAAGGGRPQIRRSPTTGPALAMAGSPGAPPAAEAIPGQAGTEGTEPAAVVAAAAVAEDAAAVAQGAGGVPTAAQASEGPAAFVQPAGGAIAAMPTGRDGRDDRVMAAALAGAAAGPTRTTGALRALGGSEAAPELAAAGPSTGGSHAAPDVSSLVNLSGPQRQVAGLPGDLTTRIAVEAALEAGPATTTPATVAGRRRLPQGDETGLSLAAEVGRGPLRRPDLPGLPHGVAETIEEQPLAAATAPEAGDAAEVAEGIGIGRPSRREGGLPVQIAAVAGPGGLGYDPSPEVGLPSRRARPESEIIHTVSRRFIIERSGGRLAIDGRVREQPTEAFRQRDLDRRSQAAQAFGGSEGTEKAVEMGLDFFARHQFPDGRWSLHKLPPGLEYEDSALGQMEADTAATGLALLTYLGAGYTHLDDKHRAVVNRGIDWLVRNQKPDGDLFTGGTNYAWFYSHGIAAIALCEAYGMTRDPQLREPARKAIEFIVKTQHPTRGGWRYYIDDRGVATETDTSVSGWQLMAIKSAQMAGLNVPQETLQKVDGWLETAQAAGADGQYVYNPHAKNTPEQRDGRKPNLAMTAEAMLMRMYLAHPSDDPGLIAGAEHLKENLPQLGDADKPLRDCYYWYYATQAMFQMQGDYWTSWNDRLRPLTQRSQAQTGEAAGSWHPAKPVPDRWGHAGGRHYVTAMHLLMLEVYYRHLPLFQELRR